MSSAGSASTTRTSSAGSSRRLLSTDNAVAVPPPVTSTITTRHDNRISRTVTNRPTSLTVACPAFNEEAAIERVVRDVLAKLPRLVEDFELLVVDDGSTDR